MYFFSIILYFVFISHCFLFCFILFFFVVVSIDLPKDILEKIRECGSSVTYYGGRVLNNQSPEVSPMTKAIMREIHNDNNICEVCRPTKKLYTSFCDADKNQLGNKEQNKIKKITKNCLVGSVHRARTLRVIECCNFYIVSIISH